MPTLDAIASYLTSFFSFPSIPAIISLSILWLVVLLLLFSVWYMIRDTGKALDSARVIKREDYRIAILKQAILKARIHRLALRFCEPDEDNQRIVVDRSVPQLKKAMKGIRSTVLRCMGAAVILGSILAGFHWLVAAAIAVYYAAKETYHMYLIDVIASNPVIIMELKDED